MAGFETRSGAYFMYVSSGCAENRHLQAALAIFGSGSEGPPPAAASDPAHSHMRATNPYRHRGRSQHPWRGNGTDRLVVAIASMRVPVVRVGIMGVSMDNRLMPVPVGVLPFGRTVVAVFVVLVVPV